MKLNHTTSRIFSLLFTLISSSIVFATATPIFNIVPVTPNSNHLELLKGTVTTVPYTITNNTFITRTLTLNPTPGVTAAAGSGSNGCSVPFILAPGKSCVLNIVLTASLLPATFNAGPEICKTNSPNDNRPTPFLCARPAPNNQLTGTTSLGKTVGGNLSGLITGTVQLLNNGGDLLSLSSDGTFTFSTPLKVGSNYDVTVQTQPAGQTCTVANGIGVIGESDISNVVVTCSVDYYTVGGIVSGLLSSTSIVLLNNGHDNLTISSNGGYTFPTPVADLSPYAVTVQLPQPIGQNCLVTNTPGVINAADITNVDVTCTPTPYTVGGTVTGLQSLTSLTLQNNGQDSLVINSDGSYTFPTSVTQGSPYSVTVSTQPINQACSVTNGSGTINGADVTNANVTCSTNYTTLALVAPTPTQANRIIPVVTASDPNPTPLTLTVQNTGATFNAYNVRAVLPGTWGDVTTTPTGCATVAPGGTCTLSFTSTTPYIAQNNIQITADYVQTPPTTALAFSINGYLVFSTDSNSAEVIRQTDISPQVSYPSNTNTNTVSTTDGVGNTGTLVNGGAVRNFAARSCNFIDNPNAPPLPPPRPARRPIRRIPSYWLV